MNKEEITRKSIFMTGFRGKLGYIFNSSDLQEFEFIIDFYEQKVNQLETNINEAIEEIKYFELQADHLDDNIYLDKTLSNKLLSILERGKE